MFKYITNRNDNMDNNLSFETMPDSELIFELADLFKVFGDSTRQSFF